MDRYQRMVRRVKGLNSELALQYVLPALKPGPFKESEAKEKSEGRSQGGQSGKTGGFRPKEPPTGPRFQQYTPLNASRAKILQEALSTELIQAPKSRPTPPDADGNKHCLWHQNLGHTIEECVTLKDGIEELIQVGQLKRYVKTERPERHVGSSARSRSPRRRPPRQGGRGRSRNYGNNRSCQVKRRSRSRSRNNDRSLRGHINTIFGGFPGGGSSSSTRKHHVRALRSVNSVQRARRSMPEITFTNDDFHAPDREQDDPMVITAEITRYWVSKVLIDQGSSANILYWKTFQRMDLPENLIVPYNEQIVGFAGERVDTHNYVDLHTRLGTGREGDKKKVRYLLVNANTSYNVLLDPPCLNVFGVILSTPHLTMKYPSERGNICTVRADQKTARECYR
ncbi:uncharacterized protein LOC108344008 [Vigna angularis]|uniref:uncharacterized protein LOC108344008 n=1 Tax=Phaseolus angularis TaxID=3914 RepID=UPI000809B7C5|nr:uncharacterized protein LOC108344008 [Vigna angularis]